MVSLESLVVLRPSRQHPHFGDLIIMIVRVIHSIQNTKPCILVFPQINSHKRRNSIKRLILSFHFRCVMYSGMRKLP
jgi:hypothetical protein